MVRFFCSYCNKFLINSSYKVIKTHFNGQKHIIARKKYYEKIKNTDEVKRLMSRIRKYQEFHLPEIDITRIEIPPMPTNFRLPPDFNFQDRTNYPVDLEDWEEIFRK